MASDKIVNKILNNAKNEADQIIEEANKKAQEEKEKIQNETKQKLEELKKEFQNESEEIKKRSQLQANIEERKRLLSAKQKVLHEAFDLAKKEMRNLSNEDWAKLVTRIILEGTTTDTEYIKVPKKDFDKYTKTNRNGQSFLSAINKLLLEQGHRTALKIDRNPAHFDDGLMLIGKYSDVNASFDVLIENQKEYLEWNVSQILFKEDE